MKTFKDFLTLSKSISEISRLEVKGGAGCTGGGFTNMGGGHYKAWDGDCIDDSGRTTYHNYRDVYK